MDTAPTSNQDNGLKQSETMTKLTVLPPDEGYSYFDMTPAQLAARVSAINIAASVVLTGDGLCDRRLAEDIVNELMETAAWLARQLAIYHDELDRPKAA